MQPQDVPRSVCMTVYVELARGMYLPCAGSAVFQLTAKRERYHRAARPQNEPSVAVRAQPFPINISDGWCRYCSMLHTKNRDRQSGTRTTVRSPQGPPRTPFSSVLDVKVLVGALLMRGKLRA